MMRKSCEGFKKIPNYRISEKRTIQLKIRKFWEESEKRQLVVPWKILFHSLLEIFMNFKPEFSIKWIATSQSQRPKSHFISEKRQTPVLI